MTNLRNKTIAGTFCHAPEPGAIEILRDALIAVDDAGRIASVTPSGSPGHATARRTAADAGTLVVAPARSTILPGFVDLHIHAPQYPQLGKALDVPLEVWLQAHTFPLEARYADTAFAGRHYAALVEDLIANGTTTALYFATVHQEATRLLVDICLEKGQRALVGKVAMDNPAECPDDYRDASAAEAIAGTKALIDYVATHPENHGLVHPVITPRFVPSCTDPLLEGLGELARECGCHVQTHCSESDRLGAWLCARPLRPDRRRDARPLRADDAQDRAGAFEPADRWRHGADPDARRRRGALPALQRLFRQCRVPASRGAGQGAFASGSAPTSRAGRPPR